MPRQTRAAGKRTLPKAGEKRVRPTKRTLDVSPEPRPGRKGKEPIVEPAVDHRKQFVGTDEPKGKRANGRKGAGGGARAGSDVGNVDLLL